MTAIVERGSAHIEWQYDELAHEAKVTGLDVELPHLRTIDQELAEYELADYIAVPSTFVARTFTAAGVSEAKLLVNPYGVDLKLFSAAASAQHEERASQHGLRVLYVGGVTAQKGVHYLAEAVDRVPGASLTLVGPVSPGMCSRLSRHRMVRAIGAVPGRDLPRWYREADVFCLLSVQDGMGLVLLQAMAMGLPVIGTSHTGVPDVIEDGVQGFIIPPRDAKAAAARLQQLADAPELRREMGARARARVAERFDWSHYGARARAHYARILTQRTRCPATAQ
jgi:glycosyltransferase involved in cell wall biosynthesis